MLVQHQVKDFSEWKKAYDNLADVRSSNGELSEQIYRDASDPNKVTLVFKWDSIENARRYANSAEGKAAMQNAGVEGHSVNFLNEI